MSNDLATASTFTFDAIERLGKHVAASGMFGFKETSQAVALMMLAHSEGCHPMKAMTKFHIINGRPSKKSEAMLVDFLAGGGKFKMIHSGDDYCECAYTFDGNEITVKWDLARYVVSRGLTTEQWKLLDADKNTAKKFPAAMWRARCHSEAIRAIAPQFASGMYSVEETRDLPPLKNVTTVEESVAEIQPPAETIQYARSELFRIYKRLPESDRNPARFSGITGFATMNLGVEDSKTAYKKIDDYLSGDREAEEAAVLQEIEHEDAGDRNV